MYARHDISIKRNECSFFLLIVVVARIRTEAMTDVDI